LPASRRGRRNANSPSPGTPGEGGVRVLSQEPSNSSLQKNPHPNPLPEYRERVKGRLRIGLVSPDFRDHPIAYFIQPLLAARDHSRLHVTCYALVMRADAFTQRLKSAADQ